MKFLIGYISWLGLLVVVVNIPVEIVRYIQHDYDPVRAVMIWFVSGLLLYFWWDRHF